MLNANVELTEVVRPIVALGGVVPSSSTPQYVSLKNFERACILILVNNATTVTGSAITLLQATDVSGTGEKAIPFTRARRNVDAAAGDLLASFDVTNSTFTTDATNSKRLVYAIEVNSDDLDIANGFDCFRVGTGNATAATVTVLYLLYPAKYGNATPTALAD